jgi:hypothetical protein
LAALSRYCVHCEPAIRSTRRRADKLVAVRGNIDEGSSYSIRALRVHCRRDKPRPQFLKVGPAFIIGRAKQRYRQRRLIAGRVTPRSRWNLPIRPTSRRLRCGQRVAGRLGRGPPRPPHSPEHPSDVAGELSCFRDNGRSEVGGLLNRLCLLIGSGNGQDLELPSCMDSQGSTHWSAKDWFGAAERRPTYRLQIARIRTLVERRCYGLAPRGTTYPLGRRGLASAVAACYTHQASGVSGCYSVVSGWSPRPTVLQPIDLKCVPVAQQDRATVS